MPTHVSLDLATLPSGSTAQTSPCRFAPMSTRIPHPAVAPPPLCQQWVATVVASGQGHPRPISLLQKANTLQASGGWEPSLTTAWIVGAAAMAPAR